MRVLCAGDLGVDHYLDTDLRRPGGCSLNLAVNLARLGIRELAVGVLSAIGDDAGADEIMAVLAREEIVPYVARSPGATAVQRLVRDAAGERSFRGYDAGVLGTHRLTAAQKHALAASDTVVTVLYVEIEALLGEILQAPRPRVLAVDFMALGDYGRTLALPLGLLERVDVGFFGLAPGDAVIADVRALSARRPEATFVVTLGSAGSVAFQAGKATEAAAVPVACVVDTTGAGDAFAAAFLGRRLAGDDLGGALAFASRWAAGVVGRVGAF